MNLTYYFPWLYWLWLSLLLSSSPSWADDVIVDFSAAQGAGVGVHDLQVNNIRVESIHPESGEVVVTYYNISFKFDPNNLHLVPIFTNEACANLRVDTFDITSQIPLAFTSITVNELAQLTDQEGGVEFFNLSAGALSVTAIREGYEALTQEIQLNCERMNVLVMGLQPIAPFITDVDTNPPAGGENSNPSLSEQPQLPDPPVEENPPVIEPDVPVDPAPVEPVEPTPTLPLVPPPRQISIGVNWGESPRDLDAHLTGPLAGTDRFHVYFGSKQTDVARLEVDDRFTAGKPEGMAIFAPPGSDRLRAGIYRFTVHHFGGEGRLSTSGAIVQLQVGAGELLAFTPPLTENIPLSGEGRDSWIVFELHVDGQGYVDIIPIQEYHANVVPGDVW